MSDCSKPPAPPALLALFEARTDIAPITEHQGLTLWQSIQDQKIHWHITRGSVLEAAFFRSLARALAALHTQDPDEV